MIKTLHIEWLGGNCPVQAEGTITGVPFYFRARWNHWSMSIGENPIAIEISEIMWYKDEGWGNGPYEAGWMPVEEAERIIRKCAAEFIKEKMHDNRLFRYTSDNQPRDRESN